MAAGELVSSVARFTLTKPRSVSWTPASCNPIDSVLTARPAAIRTFSTSTDSFLPAVSSSSVTLSAATVAFVTLAPAYTAMPRFL